MCAAWAKRSSVTFLLAALGCTSLAAQKPAATPAKPPTSQEPAPPTATVADPMILAAERWIGRTLIIRGFYQGSELEFDRAGHVKGSPKTLDWTLAGFEMDKVSRRPTGELALEGPRTVIGYNAGAHAFEWHPQKEQRLKVVLPSPANAQAVDDEFGAVFSQGMDPKFQRSLPPYWSHYFLPAEPWPTDPLAGQTIVGANGTLPADIVMPVPEKKPDPEITAEARAAHIKGTVQAVLVVDAEGLPHRIVIRQPLGWGLDARVAETLARYRFKPGMEQGKPVAVEIIFNQGFDYVASPQ